MKLRPSGKIAALIILCLLLNVGLPALFFGVNLIPGSDEIRLFNRGKAISIGDIDIYHAWDQPQLIDPYPPGYPIIVAELLDLIPSIDPFGVSYILRICLLSLMLLSYFWMGTFISRRVAFLAVIFRSLLFIVLTTNPGNYSYIFPTAVYIGGGIYSEISIIMISIFMIRYFYHQGSDRLNLFIIFFINIFHGLTHISAFITFSFFIIILLLLIQIPVIRSSRELHRWKIRSMLVTIFRSRLLKPGYIFMISPLIVFLMYFSTILNDASPELYMIDKILPIQMPIASYLILLSTSFIIGITALIVGWYKTGTDEGRIWPMPFFIPKRTKKILLFIYFFFFISVTTVSNIGHNLFLEYSFGSSSLFPSAFPSMTTVPILSYCLGMVLFFLTSHGLYHMIDSNQMVRRFFAFLYLGSYCFFSVLFLTGWLSTDRAGFFFMFIPFLIGGSLKTFSSKVGNALGGIFSVGYRATIKHVKTISIIIVIIFLVVAVVSRANSDPAIRGVSFTPSVLSFGSNTPPLVSIELIDAVKEFQTPGDAILSTPETQAALYAFVSMKPMCPAYNTGTYLPGNMDYHAMVASLYYLGIGTPSSWLQKNKGTLVVLGYLDVTWGAKSIGFLIPPVDKLMSDQSLTLVWENSHGERIFKLN